MSDHATIDPTDILTSGEAMAFLKMKRTAFYAELREGRMPYVKVGREYRFTKSALSKWIRSEEARSQRRR